jgi:hypothetical protein
VFLAGRNSAIDGPNISVDTGNNRTVRIFESDIAVEIHSAIQLAGIRSAHF